MGFMEHEITNKRTWIEIDTANGTVFVDAAYAPEVLAIINDTSAWDWYEDAAMEDLKEKALPYTEVSSIEHVYSVQTREGYGARMSASGYMDCTEWDVFDTRQEAEQYLEEMYGDEEADDDEADDEDEEADDE